MQSINTAENPGMESGTLIRGGNNSHYSAKLSSSVAINDTVTKSAGTENAAGIHTIPFPLFLTVVTSAMMAVQIVTFPLHKPPMIRARTKIVKFQEQAHKTYEASTPI